MRVHHLVHQVASTAAALILQLGVLIEYDNYSIMCTFCINKEQLQLEYIFHHIRIIYKYNVRR